MADPERQADARTELDAHHLRELRKSMGKTQAEITQILGVSQSRISQWNGNIEAMELEVLRAYAAAPGGQLDITIRVGPHSVKVAHLWGAGRSPARSVRAERGPCLWGSKGAEPLGSAVRAPLREAPLRRGPCSRESPTRGPSRRPPPRWTAAARASSAPLPPGSG
ncbi:XRE family transcriptional regulator [Nonomuraea sp. NPDC050691]|uniref:helix-turn-helix domain-containing protein n=1 Tax=Nonomuraea sp. NPDC050691 TaxID=3155661 RepID=UPI003409515D